MDGLLLVDKPVGWTSFDVVAKVRGCIRAQTGLKKPKVGHTGTLDPLATGLLVVVVGSYCKRAAEFSGLDKRYDVEMTLGQVSETGDAEGARRSISENKPSSTEITTVLDSFLGQSMQRPPAFSAVKVNGQRAYKLARAGHSVELEPRQVTIRQIKLHDYSYPVVTFAVEVSSGTYVRSLVADIGVLLHTGAYMSGLRRAAVGPYIVADAIDAGELSNTQLENVLLTNST
jgi:tRNA pseudouridine55 synthase